MIELLVTIGLLSVVMMATMTLILNQNKEVKSITEKMLIKDIETNLKNALRNSEYCSCLFRGQTYTSGAWSSFPTQIPSGWSMPIPNAPAACSPVTSSIVPPVGSLVENSNMRILSISFTEVFSLGANSFSGNLNIGFDHDSLVRALRNIRVPMSFSTDAAGNFLGCTSAASAGMSFVNPDTGYDNMPGTAACAAIGKTCQYMSAHLAIWDDAGCPSTAHCMRVCQTWYNQNLPGVPDRSGGNWSDPGGSGQGNIFSCAAEVGRKTTYLQGGVVRCGGYFTAICM